MNAAKTIGCQIAELISSGDVDGAKRIARPSYAIQDARLIADAIHDANERFKTALTFSEFFSSRRNAV